MSSDTEKTTLQRLMELKDLYDSGLITKKEMEAKKRQILGTDNPSVDNPNGEIRDELNNDGHNQADDDYRPGKCCSSSTDEEGKQAESNSEQENEQNKETDSKPKNDGRKIFILSLIAAAVVVVIVGLSIVLTPTDYNKKVAKAIEQYKTQNATILSSSGTNV